MINHRPQDIQRVPENGILVLPLSMSKLHGEQSPKEIYRFLAEFGENKAPLCGAMDALLLYTNGLYFSSPESSLTLRHKSSNQMVRHAEELRKMILEEQEFAPQAVQFIPWDYVLLNNPKFVPFYSQLEHHWREDQAFQQLVAMDLGARGVTEANTRFVLEELVVTHLIRQKFSPLPQHLSRGTDAWRLIAYPGNVLRSDLYLHQNNLLPKNKLITSNDDFTHSLYNLKSQTLIDYNQVELVLQAPLRTSQETRQTQFSKQGF